MTKTVEFERHEKCDDCDGSGAKPGTSPRSAATAAAAARSSNRPAFSACRQRAPPATAPAAVDQGAVHGLPRRRLRFRKVRREIKIPAGIDDRHASPAARRRRAEHRRRPARRLLLFFARTRSIRCSARRAEPDRAGCRSPIRKRRWGARSKCPRSKDRKNSRFRRARDGRSVPSARAGHARIPQRRQGRLAGAGQRRSSQVADTAAAEELLRELAEEERARHAAPQEFLRETSRLFRVDRRHDQGGVISQWLRAAES